VSQKLKKEAKIMSKKEKIFLLILNIIVITANVIVQATNSGSLKLPGWIVQGLVNLASVIRVFLKGWKPRKK